MTKVLEVTDLTCEISHRGSMIGIARGLHLEVNGGETVAITGRSGSGKTTILRTIAGLHAPVSGTITVAGETMSGSQQHRANLRLQHIGFIYQDFRLIAQLNAVDNVALSARLQGKTRTQAQDLARAILQRVGLSHRLQHRPHQLSGGERQRIGIARALVGNPSLILADEPTGSLDQENRDEILALLREVANEDTGLVVVTHDPVVTAWATCRYQLRDGTLEAMGSS